MNRHQRDFVMMATSPEVWPILGAVLSQGPLFLHVSDGQRSRPIFTSNRLWNATPQLSRRSSRQFLHQRNPSGTRTDALPSQRSPGSDPASPSPTFRNAANALTPSPNIVLPLVSNDFDTPPSSTTSPPPFRYQGSSNQALDGDDPFVEQTSQTTSSADLSSNFTQSVSPHVPPYQPLLGERTATVGQSQEETVIPYDVEEAESFPLHRYFTEDFQTNGLKHGVQWVRDVSSALQSVKDQATGDGGFDRLDNDALSLCEWEPCEKRKIAILGNSGEGKSTLINALLHCFDVAETDDAGLAVTSVVTEYHSRTSRHTAPFTVEAEHLTIDEIKGTIDELVVDFAQFYHPEMKEDNVSAKDFRASEHKSKVAEDTIKAAFDDHPTLVALLEDRSDEWHARLREELTKWSEDFEWPESESASLWTATAITSEECREAVGGWMEDKLWPFIKVVR